MDDGYEVIARIPTPIAGPPHYMTASEVATMDFVRTQLDIPAPKVLEWASRVDEENPVGAEYIIMEKAQGESLASRWLSLSTGELAAVIRQVVDIEARLFSACFPKHGSLYYKKDLEEKFRENTPNVTNNGNPLADRFCVGPLATRPFWKEERGQMSLDRGPWGCPEDFLTSIGKREAAWTAQLGQPRHRQFFFSVSEQQIEPKDHIALLSQYGLAAPHLIPKQEDLSSPTLRHPDLHQSNVFLCPQSKQILSIIDWQGAAILPFFTQSGYPVLCDHEPGRPQSLEKPRLSESFDEMTLEEQEKALLKLKHEQANLYYTAATGLKCERHLRALRLPSLEMRQYLITQAGMPWDGDLVNLRAALVGVHSKWTDLVGDHPCPISFTDDEMRIAMQESKEWNEAAEILATIRDSLGIDGEGGTDPENYDRACMLNREWRMQMLKEAKAEEREQCWRIWPFKDDDEDSKVPVVAMNNES
ncbi:MAG: hypothetical protein M1817_004058 [Caeruleum heppii]|nr:MAG: hypothetical protein M1817_004058 [Caeruleum heppii]